MSPTLLRRFYGSLLLFVLLVLAARPAQATHALGGEMSYRYLDANGPAGQPFRYEVTVTLYINALPQAAGYPNVAQIDLFNRISSGAPGARITTIALPRIGPTPQPIQPNVPAGCAVTGPSQPFFLVKYQQTINLPVSFDGYYAVYTLGNRNAGIDNIANSSNFPMTLYVSMAPPLILNRSPVFSDTAVAIVCQNDTTITLNNAVDPDGDRLV